jgi:hypothetical protein
LRSYSPSKQTGGPGEAESKRNEAQWSTTKHNEAQWRTMKENEGQWRTMQDNEGQCRTMKDNEALHAFSARLRPHGAAWLPCGLKVIPFLCAHATDFVMFSLSLKCNFFSKSSVHLSSLTASFGLPEKLYHTSGCALLLLWKGWSWIEQAYSLWSLPAWP